MIKTLAKDAATFYKELIAEGIEPAQAVPMTSAFIQTRILAALNTPPEEPWKNA